MFNVSYLRFSRISVIAKKVEFEKDKSKRKETKTRARLRVILK